MKNSSAITQHFFKVLLVFILFFMMACGTGKKEDKVKCSVNKNDEISRIKAELAKYKIDFKDEFYTQFPIVGDEGFKINSNMKFNLLWPSDEKWHFPFVYMEGHPVTAILESIYWGEKYNYFLIAYGWGSTGTYTYENYLFTYTLQGELIDLTILPQFNYGKGDASLITNSNFVKNFNSAGFSELKISKNEIQCNSSNLKLYSNGTEEITRLTAKYKISDDGKINLINSDSSLFYYYRNGVFDHSRDFEIRQFKK